MSVAARNASRPAGAVQERALPMCLLMTSRSSACQEPMCFSGTVSLVGTRRPEPARGLHAQQKKGGENNPRHGCKLQWPRLASQSSPPASPPPWQQCRGGQATFETGRVLLWKHTAIESMSRPPLTHGEEFWRGTARGAVEASPKRAVPCPGSTFEAMYGQQESGQQDWRKTVKARSEAGRGMGVRKQSSITS